MVLHGRIQNGVVVLDKPAALPEGAVVRVELVSETGTDVSQPRRGGQWNGRVQITDDFDSLPDDLAEAFGVRG